MRVYKRFGVTTEDGLYLDIKVKPYNWRRREHYRGVRNADFGRIYINHEEESVMDNFFNRRQRPTTLYKKMLLPAVRAKLGLAEDVKIGWSNKAGCGMCPCSPGFLIQDYRYRFDVYVSVRQVAMTEADAAQGPDVITEQSINPERSAQLYADLMNLEPIVLESYEVVNAS